jgi:hypothetical protein
VFGNSDHTYAGRESNPKRIRQFISIFYQSNEPIFTHSYVGVGGTLLVAQLVEALRSLPEGRGFHRQ